MWRFLSLPKIETFLISSKSNIPQKNLKSFSENHLTALLQVDISRDMSTNYPSLTENTVAVVFNATVHCVSDTLEGLENPTISKVDFLKIITETLECTTEPYGITTTSETCNR